MRLSLRDAFTKGMPEKVQEGLFIKISVVLIPQEPPSRGECWNMLARIAGIKTGGLIASGMDFGYIDINYN
jgi:hypothetical protein